MNPVYKVLRLGILVKMQHVELLESTFWITHAGSDQSKLLYRDFILQPNAFTYWQIFSKSFSGIIDDDTLDFDPATSRVFLKLPNWGNKSVKFCRHSKKRSSSTHSRLPEENRLSSCAMVLVHARAWKRNLNRIQFSFKLMIRNYQQRKLKLISTSSCKII